MGKCLNCLFPKSSVLRRSKKGFPGPTLGSIPSLAESRLLVDNFSLSEILKRTNLILGLLLPLIGVLIISFYYNLVKKINWNKDLFLYLLLIVISLFAFIFLNNQIFS